MGLLKNLKWSAVGKSSITSLGFPGGSFPVKYGYLFATSYGGREYRLHVCVDRLGRLCTITDGEKSAILEIRQKVLDDAIHQRGLFLHDGSMTVKHRIKNSIVIDFIKKNEPELIKDNHVFLGKLNNPPRKWKSWNTADIRNLLTREKDFLNRLFTYSILRQALKDKIRLESINSKKRKHKSLTRKSRDSVAKYGGGGESKIHRSLKEYVADLPTKLGFSRNVVGECEYKFISGDRADVIFWKDSTRKTPIGIAEIEIHEKGTMVGMYQAAKYGYLTKIQFHKDKVRSILVAPKIPSVIRKESRSLEIQVYNIAVPT